jgi:hypothetical protein
MSGDRFLRPLELLRSMADGSLDPCGPAWADAAAQAGFHPASLALCCHGRHLALLESLKRSPAWARLDFQAIPALDFETIVAWSPLTYAPGVDRWTLRGRGAALGDDLLAVSPLTLEGNALRALGDGWEIVGGLQVADLPALERLGDRLEIRGDLALSGLPRLAELGAGLRVHGNLTLADCPALKAWPEDLEVRGAVWADRPVPGAPAALAGRIACPWPGLRPAPAVAGDCPASARSLATA